MNFVASNVWKRACFGCDFQCLSLLFVRNFYFVLGEEENAMKPEIRNAPVAVVVTNMVIDHTLMGIGYGFVWPVMETFKAISKEGDSVGIKLVTIFTDGTWNNLWGACTIVLDLADS